MSTESIASTSPSRPAPGGQCPSCGAPLHADQRYCLECGERTVPMSGFLRGVSDRAASGSASVPPTPPAPPGFSPPPAAGGSSSMLTVIAGVGVLMLAMGVGVLIGRAGGARQSAAPAAQVITVGAGSGAGTTAAATEAPFHSDWPAAKSGYTVQLQTLPESGASASAVQAAKAAATAKGAAAVGALRSEEFASLTAGDYVIYSGVDQTRAQAVKALAGLKRKFPAASVIRVSKSGSAAGGAAAGGGGSGSGAGSSLSHPAPPSVLETLKSHGKSYVEKSKNLPDVISTG
jgi:hypothetical protein